MPTGPFEDTCRECTITQENNQCVMNCSCQNSKGTYRDTDLDLTKCPFDDEAEKVENCNGELFCKLHDCGYRNQVFFFVFFDKNSFEK